MSGSKKVSFASVSLGGFAEVLLLAVLYFGTARLSLLFAFSDTNASPVWPPSGLALAALLVRGSRLWPGVLLGACAANLTTFLANGTSLGHAALASLLISCGNSSEALLANYLIRRSPDPLLRPLSVLKFSVACAVSALVAACLGAATLVVCKAVAPQLWRTVLGVWWVGDVSGMLGLTPCLLLLFKRERAQGRAFDSEALFCTGLVAAASVVAFCMPLPPGLRPSAPLLVVAVLVWPLLRLDHAVLGVSIVIAMFCAVWGTVRGTGPFGSHDATMALIQLDAFLVITALGIHMVAAALRGREIPGRAAAPPAEPSSLLIWWPAVVAGIMGTLISCALWLWLLRDERMAIRKQTLARAEGLATVIESSIQRSAQSLKRMAVRWSEANGTPEHVWRRDAENFAADTPELQAIEWLDDQHVVRWVEPQQGNEGVVGFNLSGSPERLAALQRSKQTRSITFTPVLDLQQGGKGFLSIHSLQASGGAPSGFLLGVFRVDRLLGDVLSKFGDNYVLQMSHDAKVIFSRGDWSQGMAPYEQEYSQSVGALRWTLRLRPARSTAAASRSPLPTAVLSLGCLMSALVALAMHLAYVASNRAKDLRAVLVDLQNETSRANHAAQVKASFLATMSHEIRTPMNGVLGMAGLLADTQLQPSQAEMLQTIRSSGEALLQILDDILDFTKLEAGHVEIENKSFPLRTLVEDALDLIAVKAHTKGIELLADIDAQCPEVVSGDAGRIRQILLNLLGNAVKFTAKGSVVLLVKSAAKQHIVFEVEDTGMGIEPYVLGQLFAPFKQGDATMARRFGGTGLGLSISKRLAEAMGGTVAVRSQLGRGSTFALDLVLPEVVGQSDPALPRSEILGIVAAHPVARRALEDQLLSAGWLNVLSAPSEPELLRLPGAQAAALIVVDDGLSDRPRSGGRVPHIHLIDRRRAGSANERNLLKPVRLHRLAEAVKKALSVEKPVLLPSQVDDSAFAEAFSGRCVLVVEDAAINQQVMRLMLTRLGCKVTIANDGVEAVAAAERQAFDIVFMDCQMPHMDGYQATRQIRSREFDHHTPIVALTANAFAADRAACLAAGMDAVLVKPAGKPEILAMMSRFVASPAA
ncbi:MAG: response regulator [Deltaproteobacteria bacterium]|nr:response regulator [Deltaproteobacteria bacterium]